MTKKTFGMRFQWTRPIKCWETWELQITQKAVWSGSINGFPLHLHVWNYLLLCSTQTFWYSTTLEVGICLWRMATRKTDLDVIGHVCDGMYTSSPILYEIPLKEWARSSASSQKWRCHTVQPVRWGGLVLVDCLPLLKHRHLVGYRNRTIWQESGHTHTAWLWKVWSRLDIDRMSSSRAGLFDNIDQNTIDRRNQDFPSLELRLSSRRLLTRTMASICSSPTPYPHGARKWVRARRLGAGPCT